jgi:hypothetical protein
VLKEFVPARRPDDESLNAERKALEKRLGKDQLRIAAAKLPVMVIFEGWGRRRKGDGAVQGDQGHRSAVF